ncbi:MAG TPA: toluene tolerance protein [Gammaproteobacteria bacterium]|nr:toluene tolerance protein [Gammaproteobacteria bacterium]
MTATEFARLRAGARVLERDARGEKVLLTPDKRIIKLFYPRRRFTSARIYPYAIRFWNNAQRLRARGITTLQCEQLRYDRQQRRHVIIYPLLPGTTLRECLQGNHCGDEHLAALAAFMARLHASGVLFRSIHLGNILVLAGGGFGLIDIADMRIRPWGLGLSRRARNFRHLLHDRRDRKILDGYGYRRFLADYEAAAGISGRHSNRLRTLIRRHAPAFSI